MYKSSIKYRYKRIAKTRICQGDVFQNLTITLGSGTNTFHDEEQLEYAVVLTQDCDLEQDFKERNKEKISEDKLIDRILICPAYGFEDFVNGTHIAGRSMQIFTPKLHERIKSNDTYKRYHYLVEDLENGIPPLIIDFKHFITAPRSALYKDRRDKYIATISEVYREELSQRFAYFLSRIGLPDNSSS